MLMILNIICIILVVLLVFFVVESIREHNRFYTKEYDVSGHNIPASFDNTSFVVIADWHNATYGPDNNRFITKVKELQPDYILIAGDMIVCSPHTQTKIKQTADLLKQLSTIAPVYYGYGNHEYGVREQLHNTRGLWDIYIKALDLETNSNIHMLDNKRMIIKRGSDKLCISGLTLDKSFFKRFYTKPLESSYVKQICYEDNAYNVVLAHNPDYFSTYADAGADLVLAGHNHGGMIRLPLFGGVISPRFHLFPKFDRGKYVKNATTMILSGGLGTHSIPIRVNNVPELLLVRLHNTTK